eukprot:5245786-Prymnesium_polylepis.2
MAVRPSVSRRAETQRCGSPPDVRSAPHVSIDTSAWRIGRSASVGRAAVDTHQELLIPLLKP